MINNIYTNREKHSQSEKFIDLISTDLSKIYTYPKDNIKKYINKYLDERAYEPDSKGLLKAREALAKYTNKTIINGNIKPEDIFITASTSESYTLIFKSICNFLCDYEVLLPSPSYPLFESLTKYSNLKAVFYKQKRYENWDIDIKSLEKNITDNTNFIVLISPNNPTGNIITKEIFEKICEIASIKKITIIIDEVFKEFSYDKEIVWDLSVLDKYQDLLIFKLNGISKTLALPDLKLAWIEVLTKKSNKEKIIEELEINNDMFLSANSITQNILPDLLNDMSVIKDIRGKLSFNRDLISKVLKEVDKNCDLEYILPSGGIHLILTTKKEYKKEGKSLDEIEESFVNELLDIEEVFVHPGFFYDYTCGDKLSFVISIANDPVKLEVGLTKLINFLGTFYG